MTHPQTPQPAKLRKLTQLLEHLLSLLVVFLMFAAVALQTGSLFGHKLGQTDTAERTATALKLPAPEQLKELGLDNAALQFSQRDSASWNVVAPGGAAKGVLVSSLPYARDVKGFAGQVPLYIYMDESGVVRGIALDENAETPDFVNRASAALLPQWIGKGAEQAASQKVDAVSGATFSSRAIIANVQQSLAALSSANSHAAKTPVIGWGRTVAVCLVLLLGLGISYFFRGNKVLRVVQLLLNVGVLGFWCGQFLSLSLLRGWLANGFDPVAYLPTLIVLGVAVLLPFFKHKHHYCSWVCPLGSAQELMSRLPFPKIRCSAKVYRSMSRVRLWVFALLMLLLWTGVGSVALDYEPFTAFLTTTALPAVIIMAAVILVASCFVPNLWCRSLCPMGMALTLAEDTLNMNNVKNNKTPKKQ